MYISIWSRNQLLIFLLSLIPFIFSDPIDLNAPFVLSANESCPLENADRYTGFLVIFKDDHSKCEVDRIIAEMVLKGTVTILNTTSMPGYVYNWNRVLPFISHRFTGPLYGLVVKVPSTLDTKKFRNCPNMSVNESTRFPYFLSFLSPLTPYIAYYEKNSPVFPARYSIDKLDMNSIIPPVDDDDPKNNNQEMSHLSDIVTPAGRRSYGSDYFSTGDRIDPPNSGTKASPSLKSWHLLRICYRDKLDYNRPYLRRTTLGKGVDCYILDSGIDTLHPEFEGRAVMLKDFTNSGRLSDYIGHGTHVAGIIAGKHVGIAREANVCGVKVFGADGSSDWPTIVEALNWCHERIMASKRRAVINLSIQGEFSQSINDVIYKLYNDNIPVVVAAGNYGDDACKYSPGSSNYAICVGATDQDDRLVAEPDSNYGSCVTILAPGRKIYSSFVKNGQCVHATMSGSSMAAPIVSAVIALDLSENPTLTVSEIIQNMINRSTKNKIKNLRPDTSNRLIYSLLDFDPDPGIHDNSHNFYPYS